jgi:beta-glucosidase
VAGTGTPTVAVIVAGRPHGVGRVVAACHAVLYAWYPGPLGAAVIADLVLSGREPTGRLPVSLPRDSGVLPVAYNLRREHTVEYLDADRLALFGFGAGLGLTCWQLGPATASSARVSAPGLAGFTVRAPVRNLGSRSGRQLVALFGRVRVLGLVPRRAVLLGLAHVVLAAGERADIGVAVEPDAVACLGLDGSPTGGLELWLSIDGAQEPADPVVIELL